MVQLSRGADAGRSPRVALILGKGLVENENSNARDSFLSIAIYCSLTVMSATFTSFAHHTLQDVRVKHVAVEIRPL